MTKDTIYNARNEEARKRYPVSLDLDALYRDVVERLSHLMEQLSGSLAREVLLQNSPTLKLADGLVKPLQTLRMTLDDLGGDTRPALEGALHSSGEDRPQQQPAGSAARCARGSGQHLRGPEGGRLSESRS